MRQRSNFIILHVAIQLSQHNLEKTLSSSWSCSKTLVTDHLAIKTSIYFWTLGSNPLIYLPFIMPEPHGLDYSSFAVGFEIRKYESSKFVLIFEMAVIILDPLYFYISINL
jgi:hypothetical protein